jgi:hypothetical protein
MRLNRSLIRSLATALAVVLLVTSFTSSAEGGLFTKIKDTVKAHPVASALGAVAAGAGAIIAAPTIASAIGMASGAAVAGVAGAGAAFGGLGAGLGIGTTIWGGLVAAGGFVAGTIGGIGAAIGSMFFGIAGFIGGILASPLLIPALVIIGVAVVAYLLWKKYHRQSQSIGNGSNLPSAVPSVSVPSGAVVSTDIGQPTGGTVVAPATEVPVSGYQSTPVTPVSTEVTPSVAPAGASDALKQAHSDYIKAYNAYISSVTNIGGSENPDEELRTNMLRSDTQTKLTAYRDAYNNYITLLRQSNSK